MQKWQYGIESKDLVTFISGLKTSRTSTTAQPFESPKNSSVVSQQHLTSQVRGILQKLLEDLELSSLTTKNLRRATLDPPFYTLARTVPSPTKVQQKST